MSVIEVKCFDVIQLVDGRVGDVIEIYEKHGKPAGYEVEFHDSDHETDVVTLPQIDKVLYTLPPKTPTTVVSLEIPVRMPDSSKRGRALKPSRRSKPKHVVTGLS